MTNATQTAQDYVDWFIAEMSFHDLSPTTIRFLTDVPEEDCDFAIWETIYIYRSSDLHDATKPRPYRPAKWLNHVTVEGWEVNCGPEASYVITPAGECFWRFQPDHLAQATKPMGPVSSVHLRGNQDPELIRILDSAREGYIDEASERRRIELEIADGLPQFLSAVDKLGIPPTSHTFFYTLDGEWPEVAGATVLACDDEDSGVKITRIPLADCQAVTNPKGWLVANSRRPDLIAEPAFVVTPEGSIFTLHQIGDSVTGEPPRALTPLPTKITDDTSMEMCETFVSMMEDTLKAWGFELESDW